MSKIQVNLYIYSANAIDFVEYLLNDIETFQQEYEESLNNGYNEEDGYGPKCVPQANIFWSSLEKNYVKLFELEIDVKSSGEMGYNTLENGNICSEGLINFLNSTMKVINDDKNQIVLKKWSRDDLRRQFSEGDVLQVMNFNKIQENSENSDAYFMYMGGYGFAKLK